MNNLKKLTLLHSNDLHGDFLAEKVDEKLIGGVSRLSGYVNKVRNEEKNVIYTISGDMFRGSLIDSEFQGLSTIEIMNLLAPDVVTIGNHEADYGLAHMLFIEKCASFPIINANMYIKYVGKRLFNSHYIKEIDGMRVLFIGILTEEVLKNTKSEGLVGTLIDIQDAADEIGKICDAYRTEDIDMTVLLTHIGIEEDKKLAEALDPACGVDIIIGGHSHTLLSEPVIAAGIPIVQAAIGTDQIGRFDIMVDTDKNCIDSYTWQCIPITEENCPRDEALEKVVIEYKDYTDQKYGRIMTRFPRAYTHPKRNMETELGDLLAECMRDQIGADLVLLGSGSIRKPSLGPLVTFGDFMEVFPFAEPATGFRLTGRQLRHIVKYMLREESFIDSEHNEWFQFSKGFCCEFDRGNHEIISLKMNGKEVEDDELFTVVMQKYFFDNIGEFLDLPQEEIAKNGRPIEVASKAPNVLEEYFKDHESLKLDGEPRLIIRNTPRE
ncbi:MAG: bifunctional metallophosphatase/5'-nucleotidase [Solobacterium sp.]|nr:bifunctional metallophosphatase/5'-nucleotidase [Solobacterium sp.]